jgi:hypothetical protein
MHTEMIAAKAFKICVRFHPLLKIQRLSANFKLTLHKARKQVSIELCLEVRGRHLHSETAAPGKQGSPHHW